MEGGHDRDGQTIDQVQDVAPVGTAEQPELVLQAEDLGPVGDQVRRQAAIRASIVGS